MSEVTSGGVVRSEPTGPSSCSSAIRGPDLVGGGELALAAPAAVEEVQEYI